MEPCAACGNTYDRAFTVTTHDGQTHTFDSFECAIHVLAPTCAHCGIKVVGHGLEADTTVYCCDHCATADGVTGLRDSV